MVETRERPPKSREKVTFKMPRELYNSLQSTIEGTGFGSVNEFVVFVMRTIAKGGRLDDAKGFGSGDIERVRQRLRELGYIK
jgi:hypothetical protein